MKPYMNAVIDMPYAQMVECEKKRISVLITLAAGGEMEAPVVNLTTHGFNVRGEDDQYVGKCNLAFLRLKHCCDLIDNAMMWDVNCKQRKKEISIKDFLLSLQEQVDYATNGLSKTNGKFFLLINPVAAQSLASHPEMRSHLDETPASGREALGSIWGLPQRFAGVNIFVENMQRTPKGSDQPVWIKSDCPILLYVDKPHIVYGEPSFSTLQIFHCGDLPSQTEEAVEESVFESLTNASTGFMLPDLLEE